MSSRCLITQVYEQGGLVLAESFAQPLHHEASLKRRNVNFGSFCNLLLEKKQTDNEGEVAGGKRYKR